MRARTYAYIHGCVCSHQIYVPTRACIHVLYYSHAQLICLRSTTAHSASLNSLGIDNLPQGEECPSLPSLHSDNCLRRERLGRRSLPSNTFTRSLVYKNKMVTVSKTKYHIIELSKAHITSLGGQASVYGSHPYSYRRPVSFRVSLYK
jgi:hypothetical protein